MADIRYCPFDQAVMTYDVATGIYTCPDCGFKEYNQVLSIENSAEEKG